MAKLKEKDWPELAAYWNDYGHGIPFDQLDGIKFASTHSYVVVRWTDESGVNIADLASLDGGETWEMQNDSFDPITESQWRKLECVPDCDWFTIDGKTYDDA